VRGDLSAVIRAILLDPEARNTLLMADDAHGALREPLIRFTHYCRAFNLTSHRDDGLYRIRSLAEEFKQFPYESPSVFNFYLPDHQPGGILFDRNLYGPEFQILDDPSSVLTLNVFIELVKNGLWMQIAGKNRLPAGELDFSAEEALAGDAEELLDHLDILLLAGRMSQETRDILHSAITALPSADATARVQRALVLIAASPEFAVFQ